MSGDHNMHQSDSGWRKRQIALDIKAKNARELGLDYEPSIIEMAKRIFELEALLERQTALLERQTARIVDLQTHIENFDGEER